jgi:hypothetical protein
MSVSQKLNVLGSPRLAAESRARSTQRPMPAALSRLLARSLGPRLDGALIAGADPAGSTLLAARAALLTSARMRGSLADSLHGLVRAAQGPQRRWWALGSRAAVLANASELDALAMLLASQTPLYARGLALLNELLTDSTGPAYRGDATALSRALSDARSALSA